MTRLYRDRRFATYWTGQAVSELGDRVSELALPLIAITILGASSIEVGVLTAAVWTPQLLSRASVAGGPGSPCVVARINQAGRKPVTLRPRPLVTPLRVGREPRPPRRGPVPHPTSAGWGAELRRVTTFGTAVSSSRVPTMASCRGSTVRSRPCRAGGSAATARGCSTTTRP
jgi:hypothetical protein